MSQVNQMIPGVPYPANRDMDWACPSSLNKMFSIFEEDYEAMTSKEPGEPGYVTDSGIRGLVLRFTSPNQFHAVNDPRFSQFSNIPAQIPKENIALFDPGWLSQWSEISPAIRRQKHDDEFPLPFLRPDDTLKRLKRIVLPCNIRQSHWIVISIEIPTREWIMYDSSPGESTKNLCKSMLDKFEDIFGYMWSRSGDKPFVLKFADVVRQLEDNTCGIHTIRNSSLLAVGRRPPSGNKVAKPDYRPVRRLYGRILKDIMQSGV